jgi:hypothetical protein
MLKKIASGVLGRLASSRTYTCSLDALLSLSLGISHPTVMTLQFHSQFLPMLWSMYAFYGIFFTAILSRTLDLP